MGDSVSNCAFAVVLIRRNIGIVQAMSHVYQSLSWGYDSGNAFINMVVRTETTLSPLQVLSELHSIESALLKRNHTAAYQDRIIDADILLYESEVYVDEQLCIPHPLFHLRQFCLQPLCDIASDVIHPVLKMSAIDICRHTELQESISLVMNSGEFEIIVKDHEHSV